MAWLSVIFTDREIRAWTISFPISPFVITFAMDVFSMIKACCIASWMETKRSATKPDFPGEEN